MESTSTNSIFWPQLLETTPPIFAGLDPVIIAKVLGDDPFFLHYYCKRTNKQIKELGETRTRAAVSCLSSH